jgi:small subunit ribosomal protein S21
MEEMLNGVAVVLRDREPIGQLFKRFRKKYMKSGILIDVRENMYYRKPSDRKKRKMAIAKLRRLREERKLNLKPKKGE